MVLIAVVTIRDMGCMAMLLDDHCWLRFWLGAS